METTIEDLKLELARARATLRERDVYLNHVAHELRTPLTALKLQVQIRQRQLKKGEIAKFNEEYLNKMLADDERMINKFTEMVDSILDISRAYLGKKPSEPSA